MSKKLKQPKTHLVRCTHHNLSNSNTDKIKKVHAFIDEYRRVSDIILTDIWENGYVACIDGTTQEFNISKFKYNLPAYLDYNRFNIETSLTARALSSLVTQLVGVINSAVDVNKRRIYMYDKLCGQGIYNERLWDKIESAVITKPNVDYINPELSSKCTDFVKSDSDMFFGFLRLKSIGDAFGHIKIPLRKYKHLTTYEDWEMMTSFQISKSKITVRWKRAVPEEKKDGIIVGADQGKKTIVSFSDSTVTPSKCPHGHSLDSIIDKMDRKRKGSKAFKACQSHRTNLINWSLNQINFNGIKEVRLEEIININYRRNVSSKMKRWTNTTIRDKVENSCVLAGVRFVLQSSTYRSQRCSGCGFVHKSNRKAKDYLCSNCERCIDADINAAINHEIDLPDIPTWLMMLKLNRAGFFWKPDGFFDINGVEIRVPLGATT